MTDRLTFAPIQIIMFLYIFITFYTNMQKIPTRPLQHLKERHKEMARRLAMGERQIDVARAMGITPPRISDISRSPVFMEYVRELSELRDLDVKEAVRQGAIDGIRYLLRILEEGTPENMDSDVKDKIRVAHDFLDREGSAPRLRARQSVNQNVGLTLTAEDIERFKANASKLRQLRKASIDCPSNNTCG
jgi:hypothetical protein